MILFSILQLLPREVEPYPIRGLMVSCAFMGEPCNDTSMWTLYVNPSYGNCYSFNNGYNDDLDGDFPRNVSMTGAMNSTEKTSSICGNTSRC